MDPLNLAFSNFLEREHLFREEPTDENRDFYGKSKWKLHTLLKQNLEILSYYAQGGTDGGKIANLFLKGNVEVKPPCKNCGGKNATAP